MITRLQRQGTHHQGGLLNMVLQATALVNQGSVQRWAHFDNQMYCIVSTGVVFRASFELIYNTQA